MIGWILMAAYTANLRGGAPADMGGVWYGGRVVPTPRNTTYPCSRQYWRLFDEAERLGFGQQREPKS